MLEKFGIQMGLRCLISRPVPICILEKLNPSVLFLWVDVLYPWYVSMILCLTLSSVNGSQLAGALPTLEETGEPCKCIDTS